MAARSCIVEFWRGRFAKPDHGTEIAWTLERIEATRLICSVLLVSAPGQLIFQSDKVDNWFYLPLIVGGLVVALRPTRWAAMLMFGVAILGPGIAVVRRLIEVISIFGLKEARIEHQAVFTAGGLLFCVLMLSAECTHWLLVSYSRQRRLFSYSAGAHLLLHRVPLAARHSGTRPWKDRRLDPAVGIWDRLFDWYCADF
jgi:hypothetical protein